MLNTPPPTWTTEDTAIVNDAADLLIDATKQLAILRTTITRLRVALSPFAATARLDISPDEDDADTYRQMEAYNLAPPLRNLDFRRALTAFTEE